MVEDMENNMCTGFTLHFKTQFTGHLLDDVYLDGAGIGFVVDGQEGNASFVFGNYGIGCNNTGTARLSTPLGSDWHANLTDAWTKFGALKRVLLQTFQKVCIVICHAVIAFCKAFNRNIKVLMSIDFVAHQLTQMQVGICRIFLSRYILSSLSFPDRFLQLHSAWVLLLLQQESVYNCHGEISRSHAHHDQPYQNIWSGLLGILLCLLSSYPFHFLLSAAKIQQFFESTSDWSTNFVQPNGYFVQKTSDNKLNME